jgi:hypothetical protein
MGRDHRKAVTCTDDGCVCLIKSECKVQVCDRRCINFSEIATEVVWWEVKDNFHFQRFFMAEHRVLRYPMDIDCTFSTWTMQSNLLNAK